MGRHGHPSRSINSVHSSSLRNGFSASNSQNPYQDFQLMPKQIIPKVRVQAFTLSKDANMQTDLKGPPLGDWEFDNQGSQNENKGFKIA
jgi:hypothetical protein